MRLFGQPTLFRRNLTLLAALIFFGQISGSMLFFYFSQRPRIAVFVDIAARQVLTVKATLAALPLADRELYTRQINEGGAMQISTVAPALAQGDARGVAGAVLRMLTDDLAGSGASADLTDGAHPRLVVHWQEASGSRWISFPEIPLAVGSTGVWISIPVIIALLSLAGAFVIQKRLHRPLDELVHAARQVGAGEMPQSLAEEGPSEIATVARGFNRMVHDLRELDRERTLMLAGVSHDLRTPLTKFSLCLGILETDIEPELYDQMMRGIGEMDRLLGQFLDLARLEVDEQLDLVDLRALCLECIAARPLDRGCFVTEGLLPASVPGRATMLRRMISNLLDNAIKHGAATAEKPAKLSSFQTADSVQFVVSDQGPGFGNEDRASLLRPFMRGTNATNRGSGLGLSIVARIVQLHHGTLELSDACNPGGEICVQLPYHTLKDSAP